MRMLAFFFHFPPISGGASVVAVDMVNTLTQLGHEITVLTPKLDWKDEKYNPEISPKVKVIYVNIPSKSNIKIAARRCKTNLKKMAHNLCVMEQFDMIISIFHPFHYVPNAATEVAKQFKIPCIIKVDDAIFGKSYGVKKIQRFLEKKIVSRSLKSATEVFVLNENMKEIIIKSYGIDNKKICFMPNGVSLSFFNRKKNKKNKNVIFSGVMYYHRGLEILFDAAERIVKDIPDIKFILVGVGPELNKLKEIVIKKNLQNFVEFKGWVSRNEIPKYLSDATIGIGPLMLTETTKNSIPIKILEYMASSLPIISKRDTLSSDILEDGKNGFFVDNFEELYEKIVFLFKNPELIEQMGNESLSKVQKFSWEKILESTLKIYKKN